MVHAQFQDQTPGSEEVVLRFWPIIGMAIILVV